jgi:hypothetical protein
MPIGSGRPLTADQRKIAGSVKKLERASGGKTNVTRHRRDELVSNMDDDLERRTDRNNFEKLVAKSGGLGGSIREYAKGGAVRK